MVQYLRRRQAAAPGVVDAPLRTAFLVRTKALGQVDRGREPLHGLPAQSKKRSINKHRQMVERSTPGTSSTPSTPMQVTRDVPITQTFTIQGQLGGPP